MEEVTVAEAKARLSELIERAKRGEPIRITRRGKLVARLTGVERQVKPIDLDALRALTASQPFPPDPARNMRDEARY
ncbi:MAG TPA: type II toxin-antitoxin system prevent-host-death family antitoxin [Roseiarcus sp.]|nr:type II toxin-antitoxin system prevent-host-death family antitoxin [Roseiarcus sp.]